MRPAFRSAVAGLALLTACGGDSLTDPQFLVGTYTLQTVNGRTPPVPVDAAAGSTMEITGGRISLSDDGRVHEETDVRTTGVTTRSTAGSLHRFGTYALRGTRLVVVTWTGGDRGSLTLSGPTLTQVRAGFTLVYAR